MSGTSSGSVAAPPRHQTPRGTKPPFARQAGQQHALVREVEPPPLDPDVIAERQALAARFASRRGK